ncbi:hypothetical protein SAPIO_CDS10781 [Scedosporium apiospermum]|uniref:Uncharacterized protein n=1 Tax=Pseudallescheria apiosperma TaxID=563466 RepID=A0A084FUI8_PSEDA|nr:uncharacterized protein SAPIO_CDS10781 [Scedosporium apiospermum]KEZ38750.1 hypothetical protein SAPIO_CDS10781 [Scedosporium apiospermum]
MSTGKILLALAAVGASVVSAQSNSLCASATITVAAPAEATIPCETVKGSIVFDASDALAGVINISGPQSVAGDLIIRNATNINSLSSSTIETIGGKFELTGLRSLSSLDFTALESVGEISWISLTQLENVRFGSDGVTTVKTVRISDTFLSSLDSFSMVSVGTFQIDNNQRLTTWETRMTSIGERLIVADNSPDLEVSLPRLAWAANLDVRGVKSLSVPLLKAVNDSIQLTQNKAMESFIAPNLTATGDDVSFRNNDNISNISFPLLEKAGGSLTVQNNTNLASIDGFPKLRQVGGAVTMRGSFTNIELPSLDDVKGAFDVSSTEDINDDCAGFKSLAPKSSGGNGKIQGSFSCTSKNANANEGGKGGSNSSDKEDGAGFLGVNTPIILGVAALGALAQLL